MSVDLPPSKQEDVVVIGDGALSKFLLIKGSTLGFGLGGGNEVGQTKEREQLLNGLMDY